jgi:hypothetical protein
VHDLHTVDDGVWEVSQCAYTRHHNDLLSAKQ